MSAPLPPTRARGAADPARPLLLAALWSLCRRRIPVLGPAPYFPWLVFRGSMGFCALSSYYWGLYHLRVADAVVLSKISPVL